MIKILKHLYNHRFYPLLLLAAHLVLIGIAVYFFDYRGKHEIAVMLQRWVPVNLMANFFLLGCVLLLYLPDLRRTVRGLKNRTGLLLAIIAVAGVLVTAFTVRTEHRIFYDEDIYANVAQNMALAGKSGMCNYGTFLYGEYQPRWIDYNKEPSGWPFLMSLVFRLVGVDEKWAFILNHLIFGGSILLAFFITRKIAGDDRAALTAALVFALIPHNQIWSSTVAAEPAAACFAALTVLAALQFLMDGNGRDFWLLALLLPFATQMRPESILLIPLVVLLFALMKPRLLAGRQLWSLALLISVFMIPQVLHIHAMSGQDWGAPGAKFSLSFLSNNISVNGPYYFINEEFPAVITLLAGIGLVFGAARGRIKLCVLAWFAAFWGIFLFFYAGSYHYGADERFALTTYMPLAVCAGLGASFLVRLAGRLGEDRAKWAAWVVLFALGLNAAGFLPMIRREGQEAWASRYDHYYARQFIEKIPRHSIVLTQIPTMFLLWGQSAIQTYTGVNEPKLIRQLMTEYDGNVFFHRNYWCNTETQRNIRLCGGIEDRYFLEPVATAREQDFTYGLYRMSFK